MGCYSSRKNNDYVLIIGSPGSGKTNLYKKLKNNDQFSFVDIPAMDLEESIENREKFINDFQNICENKINKKRQIVSIVVSVKFERTDLMKRSLLSVIKYFHRYLDLIIIAVTHFDQSEDQDEDKNNLKQQLKFILKNNEDRIVFSQNSNQNDNQMCENLLKIIENVKQNKQEPFTLKDTIFENIDETQQQNHLRDLFQGFNNQQ
ncbi:unnamed protein product [Paramecium primaurelia]|uniref:ATPase AAA-type core domain-containing protein n=1 Tax=Paramecium primaurelia TaxID=5886 RepID=A0A8S1Q4F4_PARPR|nr:unnamed protein product [Paramecium primaurelia]